MLVADGWYQLRPRSGTSHRHFRHPTKPGKVTAPGNPGDELAKGTWNSILKQARLKCP